LGQALGSTRGSTGLADTASGGSSLWSVRSKHICAAQISPYRFGLLIYLSRWIGIGRGIERRGKLIREPRVPARTRIGAGHRWHCGASRSGWRRRRDAPGHGESDGARGSVDCVQGRRWGSAGALSRCGDLAGNSGGVVALPLQELAEKKEGRRGYL
jgi:hypothetical protein